MRRLAALFLAHCTLAMPAFAVEEPVSRVPAWAFGFEGLEGGRIDLKSFAGRPVLVVNTASRCGFTSQYADLQDIWDRFRDRGLVVLGVPSNDFGGQEPGMASEIRGFCSTAFGVSFPMTAKQTVAGPGAHPFYRWAARERPSEAPRWNFHKYLIGRDGRLAAVFESRIRPADPRVVAAIEAALARRAE